MAQRLGRRDVSSIMFDLPGKYYAYYQRGHERAMTDREALNENGKEGRAVAVGARGAPPRGWVAVAATYWLHHETRSEGCAIAIFRKRILPAPE